MHKLLERQIRKVFGEVEDAPAILQEFLDVVDAAYHQADLDRVLLERSLDLTSNELLQANRELRNYASDLENRVAERTSELRMTNASLELKIAERAAAEKAISDSEERYRALFEDSKDSIYITTPDGCLVDINPAGVELLGFDSVDDLSRINVERDVYRNPADRQDFLARVDREGFVRDGELEIVRTNGEVRSVLATTSAVRDSSGEVIAYRGILRDVTSRRRLERDLLQMQKMEAVGRLAGGVAHDFNNLLTAILAYAERLGQSLADGDDRKPDIEAIAVAAERGAVLTSRLLAFGRRQVLRPVPLDLNDVIDEMRGLLRQVIPEDVELLTELDQNVGPVQFDRTQIEQVILNLAMNAGDAMPHGGRLVVRTSACRVGDDPLDGAPTLEPGDYTRMAVIDTGVGIADVDRERIFEPFFTTKSSARGTGLGLATVYSAVQEGGGLVTVSSEIGVGTCFDVYLPVIDEAPKRHEPELPTPVVARGAECLLLVEDDPSVRTVLEEYLENLGYRVLSADDGVAGLEMAREYGASIDLILSDVVMPKMSGIELARHLREEWPLIKILLMSGHTDDRKRFVEDSLNRRVCSFLQKPFTPRALAMKIRELLDE